MVNMKKMMQQAQQMQDKLQAELAELRVSASAGGSVVTATLNGQKELVQLEIDPSVVDPEDVEMLQDLVVAAVSEASRRVDEEVQNKMSSMMPPGMGGLFG
jgi:DNA-binding YbaB/EbfC family protein